MTDISGPATLRTHLIVERGHLDPLPCGLDLLHRRDEIPVTAHDDGHIEMVRQRMFQHLTCEGDVHLLLDYPVALPDDCLACDHTEPTLADAVMEPTDLGWLVIVLVHGHRDSVEHVGSDEVTVPNQDAGHPEQVQMRSLESVTGTREKIAIIDEHHHPTVVMVGIEGHRPVENAMWILRDSKETRKVYVIRTTDPYENTKSFESPGSDPGIGDHLL